MALAVTDFLSNMNDHKATIAQALADSKRLKEVFRAIYRGKQPAKSVADLVNATGLNNVAVLQQGGRLDKMHVVEKAKVGGKTVYRKVPSVTLIKDQLLRLADNKKRIKAIPTKVSPKGGGGSGPLKIVVPGKRKIQITAVTVDDFDQFSKVRKVASAPKRVLSEWAFKKGIQRIIGETGEFTDWGGEKNDLYTSKLKYKGRRLPLAFAFKGPATQGHLTPKKLGKNGDQINRLFLTAAEIFIVQYHSTIDESVVREMQAFATMNSVREDKRIYYGVIDGDDTNRLVAAYPKAFKKMKKKVRAH